MAKIRRAGILKAEEGKVPVKAGVIPDSVTELRKGFLYSSSAILEASSLNVKIL